MKTRFLTLLLIVAAFAMTASAQGRRSLRINEVMVENTASVVDDYGCHTAWIELFNANFAPLKIESIYLTTDSTNPKMYPVPLGDVNTVIPKRQHVVFWADNQPTKGTFHTSFTLVPGQENWIGVYDTDGRLIDSVTVPATLAADQSYARANDGLTNTADPSKTWEIRDNIGDRYVTPSSNNIIKASNSKVEKFQAEDANGFAMTIMAMIIVFSALLLLCICFYVISKIGAYKSTHNKVKAQTGTGLRSIPRAERPDHDSGETIAAIVAALHEHLDAHDKENTILTINKVKRAYSPWSSKIYSIREVPRR